MVNKTASKANSENLQFGMSSFGAKENAELRQQFGQNIRLAMACIQGKTEPTNSHPMPTDTAAIRLQLNRLSEKITSGHADLLELLVRFDEVKGWESSGSKHCVAWMDLELGIGRKLGWEYLKAGRQLRTLTTTRALFRAGKLSWSKVRFIVRVADEDNENLLCHAAIDASVSDVSRLCKEYQWDKDDDSDKSDNERASRQWESRSLNWRTTRNGSTRIELTLPPETAQAFLNSVEHSLNLLTESAASSVASDKSSVSDWPAHESDKCNEKETHENADTPLPETSLSARRADAAVLMAETSLQADSRDIAAADRYQVIVSVEGNGLTANENNADNSSTCTDSTRKDASIKIPVKRPTVRHAGPIARETARRIACDCSITTNTVNNAVPTSIGRKSRLWPAAMARAIKERDQHCQLYGCTQTRNLQIHHIKHWADGGTTSIDNGVCLCQACHTKVHEGGYTIQKVDDNAQRLDEQFARQCHTGHRHGEQINTERHNNQPQYDRTKTTDTGLETGLETEQVTEQQLRGNRESFDQVRALLPTTHRFRIINANGQDIRDNYQYHSYTLTTGRESTGHESAQDINGPIHLGSARIDSTHVDSAHVDSTHVDSTHVNSAHVDSAHLDSTHVDSARIGSTHTGSKHVDSARIGSTHTGSKHVDSARIGSTHTGSKHVDSARIGSTHTGSTHADSTHADSTHVDSAHVGPTHARSTHADSAHPYSTHVDSARIGSTHTGSTHVDSSHVDSARIGSTHTGSTHADSAHPDSTHVDSALIGSTHTGSTHVDSIHASSAHLDSTHVDSTHTDSKHADSAHPDSARADSAHPESTHVDSTHTGSARADSINTGSTHIDSKNSSSTNLDSTLVSSTTDIMSHPWFVSERAAIYCVRSCLH